MRDETEITAMREAMSRRSLSPYPAQAGLVVAILDWVLDETHPDLVVLDIAEYEPDDDSPD